MDDTPPPALRARPCPICGRPAEERFRPFCSARCKMIDLGGWLDERYRIPSENEPENDADED